MSKEFWDYIFSKYPAIENEMIDKCTLYRAIETTYSCGYEDGKSDGYEEGYDNCLDDYNITE